MDDCIQSEQGGRNVTHMLATAMIRRRLHAGYSRPADEISIAAGRKRGKVQGRGTFPATILTGIVKPRLLAPLLLPCLVLLGGAPETPIAPMTLPFRSRDNHRRPHKPRHAQAAKQVGFVRSRPCVVDSPKLRQSTPCRLQRPPPGTGSIGALKRL